MKKAILSRYERTKKNEVIIDASVQAVEDLYNNFDRTAPYVKKDLDPEFVDYVIECVREIGTSDFVIRISLSNMPDEAVMGRVRTSIKRIFNIFRKRKDVLLGRCSGDRWCCLQSVWRYWRWLLWQRDGSRLMKVSWPRCLRRD